MKILTKLILYLEKKISAYECEFEILEKKIKLKELEKNEAKVKIYQIEKR